MDGNPVGWFEIYVDDMARARRFYESVFGFGFRRLNVETPELWAFPQAVNRYGAGGALCRKEGCAAGGNGTLVYFSCTDCAVALGRVAAAGGRVVREKTSIGEYGFMALAIDSEGNMIGLHSMQ